MVNIILALCAQMRLVAARIEKYRDHYTKRLKELYTRKKEDKGCQADENEDYRVCYIKDMKELSTRKIEDKACQTNEKMETTKMKEGTETSISKKSGVALHLSDTREDFINNMKEFSTNKIVNKNGQADEKSKKSQICYFFKKLERHLLRQVYTLPARFER